VPHRHSVPYCGLLPPERSTFRLAAVGAVADSGSTTAWAATHRDRHTPRSTNACVGPVGSLGHVIPPVGKPRPLGRFRWSPGHPALPGSRRVGRRELAGTTDAILTPGVRGRQAPWLARCRASDYTLDAEVVRPRFTSKPCIGARRGARRRVGTEQFGNSSTSVLQPARRPRRRQTCSSRRWREGLSGTPTRTRWRRRGATASHGKLDIQRVKTVVQLLEPPGTDDGDGPAATEHEPTPAPPAWKSAELVSRTPCSHV
jgi:hypothetical protein